MQSTANEAKQAIRQLPIHERAVAIALKNIFDQVKQLAKKQQQQIDGNHLSFISKFNVLQKRASQIVQGIKQVKQEDLDKSEQFFSGEQEKQKAQLLKKQSKIEHYWFKAISNSNYGPDLTEQQQQILKAVVDIQTNIASNYIELVLNIEKNAFVQQGVYHRRLVLDNGSPSSLQGQQPKWISTHESIDGVFTTYLFTNTKDQDKLPAVFSTIGEIINEIVPYSLEYYLGVCEPDQQQEEQQQNEEQNEDQPQDQ